MRIARSFSSGGYRFCEALFDVMLHPHFQGMEPPGYPGRFKLLVRPRLRAVLGQAEPTFTIEEVIASGKVLIVSLPVGAIGDEAAALVGSLVLARLWQAIQGRAMVAPERRRPVMVFVDEFQRFVHSATDLGETLAQARGLAAGFHLAHQHLGQLPSDLRQAVSANCRSKIVFQTAAGDAPALARELGEPVTALDLASLPVFQVVMTLAAGGRVTPPVSGRTFPLPPPTGHGEAARATSRARYGRAGPRSTPPYVTVRKARGPIVRPCGRSEANHEGPSARYTGRAIECQVFWLLVADAQANFANDWSVPSRVQMTRTHLTTGRLADISAALAARDLDVVASLAKLRLATTRQLERLHWADTSTSPLTQARRCRRTLQRLTDLGVVTRLDRRIGGVRSGSAGFVYALGPAGQRLNGGHGPAGGKRIRRPWTPSGLFVAHVLAVSELYVRLVEAERRGRVELLHFDTEPACWRPFTGAHGATTILKPDAYVVLGKGEDEENRFIEVDRGTESLPTLGRKLTTYRQYWASGREQHHRGVFPGVLVVVPDERRLQAVVAECGRQPADAWQLFQVVVWHEAIRLLAEDPS